MLDIGMILPQPFKTPRELVSYGEKFSEIGLDVWTHDHLYFSGEGFAPEAWSLLNAVGLKTQNNNTKIGTAVTDSHRYHPAVLAQRLATLSHLIDNQVVLGLGAGESMNLDPYGIDWDKPVTRTKETIDIIRKLWKATPENPIDYGGKYHQLQNASLQINPKQKIPIYLAANGPKMRKIAGRKADGWICAWPTPGIFEQYLENVEKGISNSETKKDRKDFDRVAHVFTVVTDDKNEALERLKPFRHLIAWPDEVKKAGYDIDIPERLQDVHYTTIPTQDEEKHKKLEELGQIYPEEVCLEFTVSGNADDCIEKIEKYKKAGANNIVLFNFSKNLDESIDVYSEEILPYFQDQQK